MNMNTKIRRGQLRPLFIESLANLIMILEYKGLDTTEAWAVFREGVQKN
jgi:hypothetical protein